MAACVLLAAPSVYAQALNCRPPVSSGFGSAGTIVFKVDGSLGAEETRAFNAGLGQWTGRTCSSYGLPELVTSAPFCLVNCDRETWRVRRTSRRQCGFTDPLSKTVFLNPDLGCNLAGTAAHEIGQVLNLGDVGTAGCEDRTVMWRDSTSYPSVQTTDWSAAEDANPHVNGGGSGSGGGGGQNPLNNDRQRPVPVVDCTTPDLSEGKRRRMRC